MVGTPKVETETSFSTDELEERPARITSAPATTVPALMYIARFRSVLKLHRTTVRVQRYVHNSKYVTKRVGPLKAEEVQIAHVFWIKSVQRSTFLAELIALKRNVQVKADSPIRDLSPFIDGEGILRVGGRLQFSGGTFDERHPVILPTGYYYCELLVREAHARLVHAGVKDTLVQLRERFWIIRARQLVKKIIHRCVICRKLQARPITQPSAPLPADRVTESQTFEVVGVDFAGPLILKTSGNTGKSYIVLITCAVTRAVHLELAPDMSTDSFLQAFRRFVSRRGICSVILSDNFQTFKRCRGELREVWRLIKDPEVANHLTTHNIQWKFIVELAPWWGGFYERLIRSVKTSLKKVLGRRLLDKEEMRTNLTEVEAVINSRPITHVYTNDIEQSALSPASFLIGRRLASVPTPQLSELKTSTKSSLSKLWVRRQQQLDHFWRRRRREYLAELRSAHYSRSSHSSKLNEGDVMILRNDSKPRQLWTLCKVGQLHVGKDGEVRACTVRLPDGTLKRRAVQLLYPLETSL